MHDYSISSDTFVQDSTPSSFLNHALALAKLGFRIHPLEAGTKAKPHLRGYQALATTDEAQIRQWWTTRWPQANPGIICGQGSGIIALDIDRRNGGEEGLRTLEAMYAPLPMTWTALPYDGYHYFFRAPANLILKHGYLASGVELIGEGSNLVGVGTWRAPDTKCPEGHHYTWADCQRPADIPLAELPAWVIDRAMKKGLVQTVTTPQVSSQTLGASQVESQSDHLRSDGGISDTRAVFLLAYPSTPLLEMSELPVKLDRAAVKALFSDWRVVQRCLSVLGLSHVTGTGKKFHCVIHKDEKPSASLMKAKDGEYRYVDFHHEKHEGEGTPITYSLTSLYYRKRTGLPVTTRLNASSYLTWSLRLLIDAGVLPPAVIKAPKLKGEVTFYEKTVYEGFQSLLATKWIRTDKAPTPFTWEFAAAWCGISKAHVSQAMKELLAKGYIRGTGDFAKNAALFTLGTRSLINRHLRRLKAQAKHQTPQPSTQTEVLAAVQPDIDAMLQANEAPQAAYPAMSPDDLWTHCLACGTPYDENDFTFTCRQCGIQHPGAEDPVPI